MNVFETCFQHGIRLQMEWIPRSLNDKADYISRIVDCDDWQLNPQIFCQLDALWGPHTVDQFASPHNAQLPRYNSRFWTPSCEAVDAFTTSWASEVSWLVPPLHLICRSIQHAQACAARGTLVVPMWVSAPFWPILCPDGSHLAQFIHAWMILPFQPGMFLPGHSGNNFGHSHYCYCCLALSTSENLYIKITSESGNRDICRKAS